MQNAVQKQVIDLIKRSNKILILPSSPPDGDSLGGAIGLYIALKKLQKEITVVCKDTVPELLQFLPNTKIVGNRIVATNDFIITLDCRHTKVDKIKSNVENDKVNIIITPKEGFFSEENVSFNKGTIEYDLIITVDCAELSQLGELYEKNIELFHQLPIINIDHHISNTHFGKINYVDIMASSTTELILPILEQLSSEVNIEMIDEDIATLLLTGIITDTGSFQNANTTPKSFDKAAQLIAYGARQQEIIQNIYKTKQLSQLKLWGRVLSKIQTDSTHRIVWSVVSQQDFKDTESTEEETGDIIDELMTNAPGAEIILLIKEKKTGIINCSIRTTSPALDASKIAEKFGGGGHTQAAGFRLESIDLRDAEYEIINYVKGFQADRLGIVVKEKIPTEAEKKPVKVEKSNIEVEKSTSVEEEKPTENQIPQKNIKPKQKKSKSTKSSKFEFSSPLEEEKIEEGEKEVELEDEEIIYKFED